ncbi:unnamed protein product [Urochloa decumbens]|uniref:F-box domain-containing protein n=1 Tax=Urochloa decumbens TaxID=240449 RepID=A0ABC9GYZ0_9POAL
MAAAASDDGGGNDHLSELPDDALHHIVSFLPSDDAVRTSVLARRWRHLWKSTRTLRISRRRDLSGGSGGHRWPPEWGRRWTPSTLTNFMNNLLLLRGGGGVPLDLCEISCSDLHDDDYDYKLPADYKHKLDEDLTRAAGVWIRHAVAVCHARVLRVHLVARRRLRLDGRSFAAGAPLLTTVVLEKATLTESSLDFSGCPALQVLKISKCSIKADRICSPSLARLSIDECSSFHAETRTRVSTPRLVSLQLMVSSGNAPVLESMPELVAANVRIEDWCRDMCSHNVCRNSGYIKKKWGHGSKHGCFCVDKDGSGSYLEDLTCCDSCYGTDDGSSLLLEGLSSATDLELISDPRVFIFRKDCKSPTTLFNRLKTLLLNEWCMAVDFGALVFFLQRSPVLEELTLQLGYCETRHPVIETDKSYSPTEQLFVVSKQLTIVEIKCTQENEIVKKLLMLLTTNGVDQEQIHIEHDFCPPDLSGYDSNSSEYDDYYW